MNWSGMTAIVLVMFCGAAPVCAEVYQWRDSDGKLHFSDKKPVSTEAEDISENLERTNIERSGEQRDRLNRLFAKETLEERRLNDESERQKQVARDKKKLQCDKAREYLSAIRGRVNFKDSKGNHVPVSESERKRKAKVFESLVSQHCS